MFNIEVLNTCQMSFWSSKKFSRKFKFKKIGHFTKMCSAKFPLVKLKASPETTYHKIPCLQFANKNIVGLQSWHSSRHFQIPITPTISHLELWLNIKCNFSLASTTTCEHGFSKQIWVKSVRRSWLKLATLDALMWVSLRGLPTEIMDWARIYDTWKSTKNRKAYPLELDDE